MADVYDISDSHSKATQNKNALVPIGNVLNIGSKVEPNRGLDRFESIEPAGSTEKKLYLILLSCSRSFHSNCKAIMRFRKGSKVEVPSLLPGFAPRSSRETAAYIP